MQLTRGLHWLLAAQGDPYAALLRGYDRIPAAALREPGVVWRSRTGAWVTAHHRTAALALAHPDLAGPPEFRDNTAAVVDRAAAQRVIDRLAVRFDLAQAARDSAIAALGGAADAVTELLPVLDAAVCPQEPGIARLLAADGDLRRTAAAVQVAATLTANAVTELLDADRWHDFAAGRLPVESVIIETLRHAPPVRLVPTTATGPVDLAGNAVPRGESLVVLLDAANRDPAVFPEPDEFVPNRFDDGGPGQVLLPNGPVAFARDHAELFLTALAERFPRLRADGPAVRARRAPVTRFPHRHPVASTEVSR
ncbi:cytochrome P450 [Saccharopolyspora sp. 5N708]|uniref:cytochrome P450 n=1 Tax=Saccharopolyspora sp. 5N708 TaxID=3457424 RepID=UPI003FD69127